ncbi:MAG: FkbM family methyltransferase [Bacteroidota bacterium]
MSLRQKLKSWLLKNLSYSSRRTIASILNWNKFDEYQLIYKYLSTKLKKKEKGKLLVDVGAAEGEISIYFNKKNWEVIAFEPDDINRAKFTEYCEQYNCNIEIHDVAVADKKGKLPFYTSDVSMGIKGLNNFHESHKPYKYVDIIPLKDFLNEEEISVINFLKIDTEGYDFFVLKGIDYENVQIDIILCEYDNKKTQKLGYELRDILRFLEDNGFKSVISEWYPLEKYGSGHKWKGFTQKSEDVDPDCWGNIISVPSSDFENLKEFVFSK